MVALHLAPTIILSTFPGNICKMAAASSLHPIHSQDNSVANLKDHRIQTKMIKGRIYACNLEVTTRLNIAKSNGASMHPVFLGGS